MSLNLCKELLGLGCTVFCLACNKDDFQLLWYAFQHLAAVLMSKIWIIRPEIKGRNNIFKKEKQLSIIVYGENKPCALFHCIVTGIILDDSLVYLVVPKGTTTSYLVHTAQKQSAPFFAAYYASQKVACVRNSPTKTCYALGNGLCLCTGRELILQARVYGKIKT